MEGTGRAVAHRLERYLSALATIASAAPLLGLLGTVIGMIEIFGSQSPGSAHRRQSGATGARHFGRPVQHRLRPDRGHPGTDLLALLPRPRGRLPAHPRTVGRALPAPPEFAEARMNFRPRAKDEPEINLIPFIDVLLVVLIFLMLTTTYSKFTELQLRLPVADADAQRDYPREVVVGVSSDGRYTVAGQPVNGRGVELLAAARPKRPRPARTAS
jgi:hypothetical protein